MRKQLLTINNFPGVDLGTLHSILLLHDFHFQSKDDENIIVYKHDRFGSAVILYMKDGICTFAECVLSINYRLNIVNDFTYFPDTMILSHLRFLGLFETVDSVDNCMYHFENDKYYLTVVIVNGKVIDNFGHAKE